MNIEEEIANKMGNQMVRDKNPAVEKAYQKYQILLELARK